MNGALLVFLGGLCWGFSGVCGEYLFTAKGFSADILVSLRLFFAGLIMLIFCLARGVKIDFSIFFTHPLRLLSFSVFGIFMCQFTYFYGISLSNAAVATVIQYTAPIFIILLVCLEQKRKPAFSELAALICVFFGALLLATNADFSQLAISYFALFICFLSAIGAVCYTLIPRKLNAAYGALPVLAISMSLAGSIFCAYNKIWLVRFTPALDTILALLGVIVLGTALAFALFMLGMQKIGAAKACLIASIEPLAAALIGYFWLGTALLTFQIVGFALILLGIWLSSLRKDEK